MISDCRFEMADFRFAASTISAEINFADGETLHVKSLLKPVNFSVRSQDERPLLLGLGTKVPTTNNLCRLGILGNKGYYSDCSVFVPLK